MKTSELFALFAGLLCATCLSALAQTEELEYHPFAEEGKNWMTKVGVEYYNQFYGYFIGDTIIEGKVWQKVYTEKYEGRNKSAYYAAVRDEGKKVYAIAKGSSRPRLLYDFSLKEWDIVRCGVEGSAFGCLREKDEPKDSLLGFPFVAVLEVNRIDTVRLRDGSERRRFTLTLWSSPGKDIPLAPPIVWIEGLGSGAGPFSPWMPQPPLIPKPNAEFRVYYTYWYNDNSSPSIANYDDFYDLESSTAVTSPQQSSWNDTLYDIEGRSLPKKPTQGIYIEGGKKRAR